MSVPRNYQIPVTQAMRSNPAASIVDTCRQFLATALRQNLRPIEVKTEGLPRTTMYFPPTLVGLLLEASESHPEWKTPSLVAGLVEAAAQAKQAQDMAAAATKAAEEPAKVAKASSPFTERPEQLLFYKQLREGLGLHAPFELKEPESGEARSGPIVLAEGSTGIGKGRAIMMAAIEAASQGRTPVVVTAPTLQIVGQLWGEFHELVNEKHGTETSAMIFPGSSEFCDDLKLREWFIDPAHAEQNPALAKWVADGGPSLQNGPLAEASKSLGVPLCWLAHDMQALAIDLDEKNFILRYDKNDKEKSESRSLLQRIRECSRERVIFPDEDASDASTAQAVVLPGTQIILCTHMMLALGQKTHWHAFPAPMCLLVDEAHILEETIARANSELISLFTLRHKLAHFCRGKGDERKKGTVARQAWDKAKDLMRFLQDLAITSDQLKIDFTSQDADIREIVKSVEDLSEFLGRRVFKNDKDLSGIAQQLKYAVSCLSSNKAEIVLYVEFSPTKRYPSLSVGRANISKQTGSIWAAARGGTALCSATLYVQDNQGNQKCDYVVKNLSLPLSRVVTPAPVIAKHIYEIPVMHIPAPERRQELMRPLAAVLEAHPERMDLWLRNLAKEIVTITKNATGGTLVLTTSYLQITGIAKYVKEIDPIVFKRLVLQDRKDKFSKTVENFIAQAEMGRHPIMLGLGPAWTGLDLQRNTKNPEDDNLLKHLIIACCPIGLNRTPTMQRRIELMFVWAIALEALITLKQGLGRLIRKDGVKDRHIWILDARIWRKDWLPRFAQGARKMLSNYRKVEVFE